MGQGDRGKYAEGKVADVLAQLNTTYAGFDFSRIYDARSAGGKFPARPGDYEFYASRLHGLIEVKEVAHDCRLPKSKSFKDQIPKLMKRHLAGGTIFVLVCHRVDATYWRRVPIEWLHQRISQPSWDLSQFRAYPNAEEALLDLKSLVNAAAADWGGRSA